MRRRARGECCGEIVPAALDEDEFEIGKAAQQVGDGGVVHACVVADGGVRTAARLDAHDTIGGERVASHEELGVLARVDVVGDDCHVELLPQPLAEPEDKHRFSRANRPADSNSYGSHEMNSLSSAISWRIDAISSTGSNHPMSSSEILAERLSTEGASASSVARTRCAPSCPMRISFGAAMQTPEIIW